MWGVIELNLDHCLSLDASVNILVTAPKYAYQCVTKMTRKAFFSLVIFIVNIFHHLKNNNNKLAFLIKKTVGHLII